MKDMHLIQKQLIGANQTGASAPTPPSSPPPPTRTADHASWPLLTNEEPLANHGMTGVQLFPPGSGTSLVLVADSSAHQNKRRKGGRSSPKSTPSQEQYTDPSQRKSDSDQNHSDGWMKMLVFPAVTLAQVAALLGTTALPLLTMVFMFHLCPLLRRGHVFHPRCLHLQL